jgi:argonaute-like protein implicated in RNA metabolism and viral defense
MNKDISPCLEAIDAAITVDMASSHHPVTHHDTTVCAEEIVVVTDVASDVASLEPVTRIIANNPDPVALGEETISS